jgi:hypothetical protein
VPASGLAQGPLAATPEAQTTALRPEPAGRAHVDSSGEEARPGVQQAMDVDRCRCCSPENVLSQERARARGGKAGRLKAITVGSPSDRNVASLAVHASWSQKACADCYGKQINAVRAASRREAGAVPTQGGTPGGSLQGDTIMGIGDIPLQQLPPSATVEASGVAGSAKRPLRILTAPTILQPTVGPSMVFRGTPDTATPSAFLGKTEVPPPPLDIEESLRQGLGFGVSG